MGIIGNFLKNAMLSDPSVRKSWELIEKMHENGEISRSEADKRQADLEETLHGVFDSNEQDES